MMWEIIIGVVLVLLAILPWVIRSVIKDRGLPWG